MPKRCRAGCAEPDEVYRSFTISRDRFETRSRHRPRMKPFLAVIVGVLVFGLPSLALADPCEGALPSRPGSSFGGTVRYVADGDSLCVGSTGNPSSWIEVRLADFDAPELHSPEGGLSKRLLAQVSMGRPITCTAAAGRSGRVIVHDRVIAACRIGGRPVGGLLRAIGAPEGGR